MDIRLIFDFLNDIEIREDPKTGTITNSILVILLATVVEMSFIAFLTIMLFF